jgi:hypothetical protein
MSEPVDRPKSDVSQSSPSPEERSKTNPALKETLEGLKKFNIQSATGTLPLPPCHYCAEGYIDPKTKVRFIFCNHRKYKGSKSKGPVPIPYNSCVDQCYKIIEWAKKRSETQKEERQNSQPKPTPVIHKTYVKPMMEKVHDGSLSVRCEMKHGELLQMKELPCLTDHSWTCQYKQCDERLGRRIMLDIDQQYPETANPRSETIESLLQPEQMVDQDSNDQASNDNREKQPIDRNFQQRDANRGKNRKGPQVDYGSCAPYGDSDFREYERD